VTGCGRNVDERRCNEGQTGPAAKPIINQGFPFSMQHDESFFILARSVPADRFAGLKAHKAAMHAGGLGSAVQEGAVALRASERHGKGMRLFCLR
jgi:hypothetical protein